MARLWLRRALTAAFTAALLLAVAWLGQIPFGSSTDSASVRLALRAVQGKVEVCSDRTAAELEALPAHMRQARSCDEITPPYRLELAIDSHTVLDEEFAPGGLRGDRPIIVDRQVEHAAGVARIQVRFEPVLDAESRRALAATDSRLPAYAFDRRVDLAPGRIALLLLDEAGGRIELYGDAAEAR